MSLMALRYEIKHKPREDKKRGKVKPKTLLAHIECCDGFYNVLDLTNKNTEFPKVIVSKRDFDYLLFCEVIENYMRTRGFTSFTMSELPN